jgi:hypothetical protein
MVTRESLAGYGQHEGTPTQQFNVQRTPFSPPPALVLLEVAVARDHEKPYLLQRRHAPDPAWSHLGGRDGLTQPGRHPDRVSHVSREERITAMTEPFYLSDCLQKHPDLRSDTNSPYMGLIYQGLTLTEA